MINQDSFDGKVIKKIPYLTPAFLWLAVLCTLIFIIGYIPLHLTDNSTPEFRSIVFMELYQGVLGDITFGSLFSGILFFILYTKVRRKVPVKLTIEESSIHLTGPQHDRKIEVDDILEIRCHDQLAYNGQSKEIFSLFIKSRSGKSTYFFLTDYPQADKLFELLIERKIKLEVYDRNTGEINDD